MNPDPTHQLHPYVGHDNLNMDLQRMAYLHDR